MQGVHTVRTQLSGAGNKRYCTRTACNRCRQVFEVRYMRVKVSLRRYQKGLMGDTNMISLKINNIPVYVEEGTTLLEAARSIGIKVPTLCHLKGISELGAAARRQ